MRGEGPASAGNVDLSNNAWLGGAVVAGGNLSLVSNSRVAGNAYVALATSTSGNSSVNGTVVALKDAATPCDCGYDLPGVMATMAASNDNSLLLADPGVASSFVDGGLDVGSNEILTLPAGDFYLTYLQVRNNAAVVAGAGSQVRLFVAGDVVMENNSDVNFPPAMGASVAIYATGGSRTGGALTVENNNESALTIYAPAADIVVRNNGKIYGTITGRNVTVQNNGNLYRIGAEQPDPSPRCPGFGRP